ncbi:transposase [Advenella alkanexedens]|uniref:Transposase n=1 Tax=Advenella alkanexedens TaxID=1481665 RepID=A0ABS6NL33_9BURK|nr:transposase [Advenella alkanexedens]MBV4396343.1 transposase [Advenella alkanexedens]
MDVSLYSVPVAERPRRRYSNEYKRQVVEASFQANTSIAAVAQAHQINANLLHTWVTVRNCPVKSSFQVANKI